MANKISFNKLKLSKNTEVSTIKVGDVEVEVKHFVPILDKLLAIDTIIQEAFDYNMVNKAKADALINLYAIMLYTNINFSKKERDSLYETYDVLEKNGVIDLVTSTIPEIEYNAYVDYCKDVIEDYNKYKNSVVGIAEQILGSLPDQLEGINDLLNGFDPSKLSVLKDTLLNFGGDPDAIATNILSGQK
jgi:hypothetical protein